LFVVYRGDSREPNFERTIKYLEAVKPKQELQEFYKIEFENEKKKNENKK
jgi:hypothetical protein